MRCSKCGAENPARAKFLRGMRVAIHASMRLIQDHERSALQLFPLPLLVLPLFANPVPGSTGAHEVRKALTSAKKPYAGGLSSGWDTRVRSPT